MNRKRSLVSLLTASCFCVLAVTGVLAFVRPFSIGVVGLHALMGFVFVGLVVLHVVNNQGHLSRYLRSREVWAATGILTGLTALFLWRPGPVQGILGLSHNLGPALERFEMTEEELTYRYSPAPSYKLALVIRTGEAYDSENPPLVAIWLENASFYHIKTLHEPPDSAAARVALPYWDHKVRGWEEAMRKARESGQDPIDESGLHAVSGPTRNSSFDPADYILPPESEIPMPYRLLVEIDQPDDGQPSLVYAVEIDNADPRAFQLLELVGYPKREEDGQDVREAWELYFIDERFDSALDLIDSALLTIDRGAEAGAGH